MRYLILCLSMFAIVSCNKEALLDAAPSMTGTWKHYTTPTDYHIILVKEDGTGKLEWYNHKGLWKETKFRDWYFKDNTMYFGKVALNGELYDIDEYPAVATAEFIEGYDTVHVDKRYVKLDNVVYVDLQ